MIRAILVVSLLAIIGRHRLKKVAMEVLISRFISICLRMYLILITTTEAKLMRAGVLNDFRIFTLKASVENTTDAIKYQWSQYGKG